METPTLNDTSTLLRQVGVRVSGEEKKRTHLVVGIKSVSNTNVLEPVALAFEMKGGNEFRKPVVSHFHDRVGKGSKRRSFGGRGGGGRGKMVTRVTNAHYD